MTYKNEAQRRHFMLSAVPLRADWALPVRVGRLRYEGQQALTALKRKLGKNYVVRRRGNELEVAASARDLVLPGDVTELPAGDVARLVAARLTDWLAEHLAGTGRQLFPNGSSLIVLSSKSEDDLLRSLFTEEAPLPVGVAFRAAFELEVRVVHPKGCPEIIVAVRSRSRPIIDTSVSELISMGVPVEGLYVRRAVVDESSSVERVRLAGKVQSIGSQYSELLLTDHDEGCAALPAQEATLEPRMEVLAHVLSHLRPALGSSAEVLEKLRAVAARTSAGPRRLHKARAMAQYLRKLSPVLLDGQVGSFGDLISSESEFPRHEIIGKPSFIFDARGMRRHRWNQGGLDQHGPFDRYQFNPKRLNVAVVCQEELQGRVEKFVEQFLDGIPGSNVAGTGFIRRFSLEKPYVQVFSTSSASADGYRRAAVSAIEHIADRGESWNLALVQTREAMEELEGGDSPYLETKAFFLRHGIAVQHVHFETMEQKPQQRAYSLNNMGLACYAKLGGVPWLLPSDQTVAHELVIGLGSYVNRRSRFGSGDRYVGITTVFSGDGRYLLESRTRAVDYADYGTAMLEAVRTAVSRVREDYAWAPSDPVRLVFHAFKPLKGAEVRAVQKLMVELALPHAEFAFLHIADSHPFELFDSLNEGVPAGMGASKGRCAPPRGLAVHLSRHETLLCLKGSRELKQARDGHPAPLLLRLHGSSSFRDLTYLTQQVFAFSCHSWRSFLPAPMPITVLYSQLVAQNLKQLSAVSGWSDDAIAGRTGRTRWFL